MTDDRNADVPELLKDELETISLGDPLDRGVSEPSGVPGDPGAAPRGGPATPRPRQDPSPTRQGPPPTAPQQPPTAPQQPPTAPQPPPIAQPAPARQGPPPTAQPAPARQGPPPTAQPAPARQGPPAEIVPAERTPAPAPPRRGLETETLRLDPWRRPEDTIEVAGYLGAVRNRLAWLIIIPLCAAALAVALLAPKPQQYEASATVALPVSTEGGSATGGVSQAAADFEQLVDSDSVLSKVSKDTGVPKRLINNNLSVTRLGTSSLVRVTYKGRKKAKVFLVAGVAARVGVQRLFEPQVRAAEGAVKTAQAELDAVQNEINEFNAKHGLLLDPQESYRASAAQLVQLRVQLASAQSGGFGSRVTALQSQIATHEKEVKRLGTLLIDYKRLEDRQTQLATVANAAVQKQGEARARLEASKAPSTVDVGNVKPVSKIRSVVVGAISAGAAALMLVIGLIVLLELFRPTGGRPGSDTRRPQFDSTGMAVGESSRPSAKQATPPRRSKSKKRRR